MMKKQYFSQAFSLAELLVVLIIIGILLSAGLPVYRGYVQESRANEAAMAVLRLDLDTAKFYERKRDNTGYQGLCTYLEPIITALNQSLSYQLSCVSGTTTDYQIVLTGQNHLQGLRYQMQFGGATTTSVPDGWLVATKPCMMINANGDCMGGSAI